jgi:hypothetical protein
MKRYIPTIVLALLFTVIQAQRLCVVEGNVTTQYTAAQAGEMTYADNGATLTIAGKTYTTSDITLNIDNNAAADDNTVTVSYDGSSATVIIAGNVAPYVTATVSGAHVSILQTNTDDIDGEDITYSLTGNTTDGEFYLKGDYKTDLKLNDLTLTNPNGPAIYINNGKKINVTVKKDTENTLTDGSGGDWKGCFRVKGHTELKGKGTLNIYGNSVNGFWGKEYLEIKNCTLNIKKAVGDGINVNQYFLMSSGTLNVSNVGDDGVQVSFKTDDEDNIISTNEDEDNTGELTISGGTVNISTTAIGSKGLKAEGALIINENSATTDITVTNSGGVDTSDSSDLKASACLKADKSIAISSGTLSLTNSGQGGRAMNCDGTLAISGGTVSAKATGSNYGSSSGPGGGGWRPGQGGGNNNSSSHKYAKGVKADGAITISGGDITVSSSNHEGMESKSTIDISGGQVSVTASDDAINSASHFTVSGGYVMGYSTSNDGLDANGNMYIKGGLVYAIGARSPEVALDANTEGGYKLYVQGGIIIAIGGLEGGASLTQSCYSASTWNKSTWYALTNGNDTFCFKTPSSGGTTLVVSASSKPTLKSGVTVSGGTSYFGGMGNVGASVSNGNSVSLANYSGGGRW